MKNRKKYFMAHFVTDMYSGNDEYEMFIAENAEAVELELENLFGEHLIFCEVRKATWAQRRYYKKYSGFCVYVV